MSKAELKAHLAQLRRELDTSDTLDPDARRLLERVAAEIDEVLVESDPDYGSLRGRLESRALGFEAEHPQFARILADVTDVLAKIGI